MSSASYAHDIYALTDPGLCRPRFNRHPTDAAMQDAFLAASTFDTAIQSASSVDEALWLRKRLSLIITELLQAEDAANARAELLVRLAGVA